MSESKETMWQSFGVWLKGRRESSGKTQEEIAKLAKMHTISISRIENGQSTKRETIIELARAIGIDESEALAKSGFASLKSAQKPTFQEEYDAAFERIKNSFQLSAKEYETPEDAEKAMIQNLEVAARVIAEIKTTPRTRQKKVKDGE